MITLKIIQRGVKTLDLRLYDILAVVAVDNRIPLKSQSLKSDFRRKMNYLAAVNYIFFFKT